MPKVTYDPVRKVWRGPDVEAHPYGKKSAGKVVYEALMKELDHVCQINDDSNEIYTNKRMLTEAISVANGLKAAGFQPGDKIVFLMHNHHYLLPTWLGCIFAGVVFCNFYFLDSSVKDELCELIGQIKPKMMITSYLDAIDTFKAVFEEVKIDCPIYIYENNRKDCHDWKPFLENFASPIEKFVPPSVEDPTKELLLIVLSSSTTGKPKLINTTHSQMLLQTVAPLSKMVISTTMQPGWQSEFLIAFTCLMNYCFRITRALYTIEEYLLMMEKHKIQVAFIKPKDIFRMIKSDVIKSVNLEEALLIISVGEHMSIKMAEDLQKYIPNGTIISMYGISDLGGIVCEPSEKEDFVDNVVGKVRSGTEYVVLDENGDRLGPNQVGEFGIKLTALQFPGYYNNPKLTKESMNEDGYFYSGDMGYIEEDGHIYLIERKKYHIPYCGKVINQSDVERIVLENVKGVNGVCVVDVESDAHGMVPYIAIIPEKGIVLKKSEVIETVMKHHPFPFETKVFFFENLPMTISGKYKKHLVREMIMKLNE
ncbi:uncharacterized protein LOC134835194 [Culicoides brevitarsis]|uniref:uncharacterized protein LOC134835194 n=1 Tax=Culicoides brevitarsis TaxID=469753 RepID=UPI00307B4328